MRPCRGGVEGATPGLLRVLRTDGVTGRSPQRPPGQVKASTAGSKQKLQRELDLPRGSGRVGKGSRRGADAGAREIDLSRVREICVIENIEGLHPELQIESFIDSELLEQRSVDVGQVGATDRSARHVPEGPCNRQPEGIRILIVIRCPQKSPAP